MSARHVAILAYGACSPLGAHGDAAISSGQIGERAKTAVRKDDELVRSKFARPFLARAVVDDVTGVDRARTLLEKVLAECAASLDSMFGDRDCDWRKLRVGAAIGTSSGGMRPFEERFGKIREEGTARPIDAIDATYVGPFARAERPTPIFEPASLVLGACASSTLAIGLGREWLLQDRCDIALCGGFDAVSVFVAAGFESLHATCSDERGPRPFRVDRDGLALGEGAAVVALAVRDDLIAKCKRPPLVWITGFGASCDASHLTAPESTGGGLARAAKAALAETKQHVDLVSAHGTATQQNDAAESAALGLLAKEIEGAPIFSFKGTIGHTLGAAGALELLAAVDAMARGIAPASSGTEGSEIVPGTRILDRATGHRAERALKISSAFGGANAAIAIESAAATTPSNTTAAVKRNPTEVFLSNIVCVTSEEADPIKIAEQSGYAADRLARADDLVRLSVAAVAKLDKNVVPVRNRGFGMIVGHGLATIETNARFLARLVTSGVSRAEPRRFAYTTPNAPAGECAVAYGLTGPSFAVGGGPHGGIEAIDVAADLVRGGHADAIVVAIVDEAGEASHAMAPGTESGAVCVLVHNGRMPDLSNVKTARVVSSTVRYVSSRTTCPDPLPPMHAHRSLQELANKRAESLEVEIPWGGFAKLALIWL
jgi:3-oxoacyl-[acyl-carrier-protein] synthase II